MGIDHFKCERCNAVFDEWDANYKKISETGLELCNYCFDEVIITGRCKWREKEGDE